MTRKIAVVTTFSEAGWGQYAERMILSWLEYWPSDVDLIVYPDERVGLPRPRNLIPMYEPIPERDRFIRKVGGDPQYRGDRAGVYNYRFDAVKFCHKPFVLCHTARTLGDRYAGMVWLDADTITHTKVTHSTLKMIAPKGVDVQFLGRCYKYTECGYIYFDLKSPRARALLDKWVSYYTTRTFRHEKEWHDSWLFDCARAKVEGLKGNDLTGHLPRRKGAGHPFVNSFLGLYMDHFKGNARKATGQPRRNDLHLDHDSDYWRRNPHAKVRRKNA